ncbi:MAG: CAP domain-containing protein, partial [Actinobacteria bacterium]
MRTARRVVVLAAALVALAVATAAPASAAPESTFLSRINASRAAAGLPPLQTSGDLADDARAWSQRMLEAGAISHNPDLGSVTTGWETLGENVGVGPDEGTLHDAFMASPGHRQ